MAHYSFADTETIFHGMESGNGDTLLSTVQRRVKADEARLHRDWRPIRWRPSTSRETCRQPTIGNILT
jgi:hypothetical protein